MLLSIVVPCYNEEENIVSKNSEILQYEQLQDEQLQEKDEVTEQIDENINDKFKYTIDEKTGEEIVYDEKEKRHSNNSIEIAGVIGSLVSGLLIIFKRIKH